MHSKLISRLRFTSWLIIILGLLVCGYLLLSAPATQIVTDRQAELVRIGTASSIAELKAHASGLVMVGSNASHISMVLLKIAILASLFFAVLAGFSLHWLGRLARVINEKSPHAH
jgi:hypothetical protein